MANGTDTFTGVSSGTSIVDRQLETGSQYWRIVGGGGAVGTGSGTFRNSYDLLGYSLALMSSTSGSTTICDCSQAQISRADLRFVGTSVATRGIGINARSDASLYLAGGNGYYCRYQVGDNWRIYKQASGTFTALATDSATAAPTVGQWYDFKFVCTAANKQYFVDSALRLSSTDNAVTTSATAAGFSLLSNLTNSNTLGVEVDNFYAAELPPTRAVATSQAVTRAATR